MKDARIRVQDLIAVLEAIDAKRAEAITHSQLFGFGSARMYVTMQDLNALYSIVGSSATTYVEAIKALVAERKPSNVVRIGPHVERRRKRRGRDAA